MNVGHSISIAFGTHNTKKKKDLAEFCKVTPVTVSNWLANRSTPSPFQMEMIASFFGYKVSELIALSENANE